MIILFVKGYRASMKSSMDVGRFVVMIVVFRGVDASPSRAYILSLAVVIWNRRPTCRGPGGHQWRNEHNVIIWGAAPSFI